MGYSPWGHKELDTIERLTISPSELIKIKSSVTLTLRAKDFTRVYKS